MFQQIERGFQTKEKGHAVGSRCLSPQKKAKTTAKQNHNLDGGFKCFYLHPYLGGRRPIGRASSFSDGWGGSKRPPTSKLFLPPKKISRSQASKALLMSRAEPHFGQAHRHLKEVRGVGWHASLSEKMKLGNLKPSGWRFSRSCFTFLLKFHFDVVGFHCMK